MLNIVIYHHVSDRPDPLVENLDVRTGLDVFERHIRWFARNFDLVSVADLTSGKLPRRALLVSFDDAYRSVLDVCGPVLKSFNAPSVFFLNPSTVTARTLPVDNLLSLAVDRLGMAAVSRDLGLSAIRAASAVDLLADHVSGLTPSEVDALKASLLGMLGMTIADIFEGSRLFIDRAAVRELPAYGIDVGNHSMTHSFFRSLSRDELRQEIVESRALLEELSGRPVSTLSIPYGNEADATRAALEVARESGHEAIFLVHDRSNMFRRSRDVYYRTNPRNAGPAMLPLRVQAVPMLRTIVNWAP